MRLDRASIVQAALSLLDEVGIDGLSTRRLAARLGIQGPSLYWHFKSKRDLLDQMAESMLDEAIPAADPAAPGFVWLDWLAGGARGIRRVGLSHRDGGLILAGYRPNGARAALKVSSAEMLSRSGLSAGASRLVLHTLGRFAVGWVLDEQVARREHSPSSDAAFEFGLQLFLNGVEDRIRRAADPVAQPAAGA